MPTAPAHLPSAGRRALTPTIRAGAVAALPAVADPAAAQGAPTASDADVGLHATGAIVAAGVVTGVSKAAAGRARPYVTGDSNAHSFGFARGLRRDNAYRAFPSGHATAAFAFAAALSGEGRRRWARANRVTELLAYTAASLVALSRVYHDRHWASDAVMGSAIGLVTGRALVRYQHECPADALDGRLPPGRAMRAAVIPAAVSWPIRC